MVNITLEQAVGDIIVLTDRIREVGKGYFHSTPLSVSQTVLEEEVSYSLFDWGLIGAVTESPLLLLGDTDRGKTDFAKIIMTALFGEEEQGWHKTDIDLDFGALTYSDSDFSAISSGKTTEELFFEKKWLYYPGLIWDEPNRAPAKLVNKLLHTLEKEFTLENGKKIFSGYPYRRTGGAEQRYQYHILAMNEGDGFHGTSEVDRALKRRQTIEIPVDIFPTRMFDKKLIGEVRTGGLIIRNGDSSLDEVIKVLNSLESIPVSTEAEQFKLYVQSMSYCAHSLSKSKKGINFGENICLTAGKEGDDSVSKTGCHYLASYPNKMCPNVYEISDGVSIKFGAIGRAYALMRAAKVVGIVARYVELGKDTTGKGILADFKRAAAKRKVMSDFENKIRAYLGTKEKMSHDDLMRAFVHEYIARLKVEPADFHAILPFITYSKQELNPHWVERQYQGGRWFAIKDIGRLAYERVTGFQRDNKDLFEAVSQGNELTGKQSTELEQALKNDIWLERSLEAYREKKHTPQREINNQTALNLLS